MEPVVTTVEDREMTDTAEIKQLFQQLKDMQHNVQMVLEDPEHPDYLKFFDNVRITGVGDNTVDLHVFYSSASAKFSAVPFLNIRKVKVLANKQIVSKKYKVSRWQMMDVAEIDES